LSQQSVAAPDVENVTFVALGDADQPRVVVKGITLDGVVKDTGRMDYRLSQSISGNRCPQGR
jgi:hypothetical protein